MFQQMLFIQWKVSRFAVLLLLPLCIALPVVLLRLSSTFAHRAWASPALDMLRVTEMWSVAFPVLAAIAGCTVALTAWTWDHRTNHIYALSLPIERWRYALLKMGSGALVLGVIILGILVGALIAVTTTDLPEGVRAYPFAFAIRFMFAALICYAITFAFAAGTMRTTIRVLAVMFFIFIVGSIVTDYMGTVLNREIPSPLALWGEALVSWPGPFNVFGGSWMLIDV